MDVRCLARATLLATAAAFAAAAPAAPAAGARFVETRSAIQVDVRGTVATASDNVQFIGPVRIQARTVTDPTFGSKPQVELSFDLSGVAGQGLKSGHAYVTQAHEVIQVPMPSDGNSEVGIDFVYQASDATGPTSDGVARAGFKLVFVPHAGSLAVGRGWVGTPPVVLPPKK